MNDRVNKEWLVTFYGFVQAAKDRCHRHPIKDALDRMNDVAAANVEAYIARRLAEVDPGAWSDAEVPFSLRRS